MNTTKKVYPAYNPTTLSFDQDLLFRQETFPRGRTYRIYPPVSAKIEEPQSHNFNIASIPQKQDMLVSNLPLIERAHLQRYNIKCNKKNFSIMLDAPKYIFDAYHFNVDYHDTTFSKTHYFAIAPSLAEPQNMQSFPAIYRMSVSRDLHRPEHFSFTTYAIAGGYADGFYFMSRLDNNVQEFAHINKKQKHNKHREKDIIDFPHIHLASFDHSKKSLHELTVPEHLPQLKNRNIYACLNAYMDLHNISPMMMLVREDMRIDELTQYANYFHTMQSFDQFDTNDLGKIALSDFGQYEVYTEHNHKCDPLPTQECGAPYLRP